MLTTLQETEGYKLTAHANNTAHGTNLTIKKDIGLGEFTVIQVTLTHQEKLRLINLLLQTL
jgi:hypothetical protein